MVRPHSRITDSTATPVDIEIQNLEENLLGFAWQNLSPRDRATVMADASKTLWIFGAGASHHYDLNARAIQVPLASGFFEAFQHLPTSQGFNAHIGPLVSYLKEYRNIQPDHIYEWTENIETFMTSLENELLAIKRKKGKRTKEDQSKVFSLAPAINNMTFILASVINEAQNGQSFSLYSNLLDFCGPNDTFVTFNWDTLLDRSLAATGGWSPNDGYGLSFWMTLDGSWKPRTIGKRAYKTNWKLLKLHGSTNWLVPYRYVDFKTLKFLKTVPMSDRIFLYWQSTLPFKTHNGRWRGGYAPTCYGYYPPNIPGRAFPKNHLLAPKGRSWVRITPKGIFSPFSEPYNNGAPSSPLLITPVRQKRYEDYETSIGKLWRQAEHEAQRVQRIVVVGYSFPATDTRALNMLRRSLSNNVGKIEVEIVAPDAKEIASRIGDDHLKKAKSVSLRCGKFEDYVSFLAKQAPKLMLDAGAKNAEVRDWIKRIYMVGRFQ